MQIFYDIINKQKKKIKILNITQKQDLVTNLIADLQASISSHLATDYRANS